MVKCWDGFRLKHVRGLDLDGASDKLLKFFKFSLGISFKLSFFDLSALVINFFVLCNAELNF